MSQQQRKPEPFGYFKADAFAWTDCAETDDGARPLYDQATIDDLINQLADLQHEFSAYREGSEEAFAVVVEEKQAAVARVRTLEATVQSQGGVICDMRERLASMKGCTA